MENRRLVLAVCVILAVLLAVALWFWGPYAAWLPGCLVQRYTGFYCPGCGMTRAAHALLIGDFVQAFRLNPLGVFLFPLLGLLLAVDLVGWTLHREKLLLTRGKGVWLLWILAILLVYGVLRNVPVWPCTLLAPP